MSLRFCISSSFKGCNTGGGLFSVYVWSFFALSSRSLHWLYVLESNHDASIFSFVESVTGTAVLFSLTSTISRWSHTRSKQTLQMMLSSSPVVRLMLWMVRYHFRQCTSRSRVWSARSVATFSIWDARAGHWVSQRSSTLMFIASSISWHVSCSVNSIWSWILSLVRRLSSSACKVVLISSLTAYFKSSWRALFTSDMDFLFGIKLTALHKSFRSCDLLSLEPMLDDVCWHD